MGYLPYQLVSQISEPSTVSPWLLTIYLNGMILQPPKKNTLQIPGASSGRPFNTTQFTKRAPQIRRFRFFLGLKNHEN